MVSSFPLLETAGDDTNGADKTARQGRKPAALSTGCYGAGRVSEPIREHLPARGASERGKKTMCLRDSSAIRRGIRGALRTHHIKRLVCSWNRYSELPPSAELLLQKFVAATVGSIAELKATGNAFHLTISEAVAASSAFGTILGLSNCYCDVSHGRSQLDWMLSK